MRVSRRSFFALPALLLAPLGVELVLVGQKLKFDRPVVVPLGDKLVLQDCEIEGGLRTEGEGEVVIANCSFKA